MAFEAEEIILSQQIFYYLLQYRKLSEEKAPELYRAYTENEKVMELVKSQGEAAECLIERYGTIIYLIPKETNEYLGFSKRQLKIEILGTKATDKDYYLAQFVILTLLNCFYNGQGNSSKAREFMRVGELINEISGQLKEGKKRQEEQEKQEIYLSFSDMQEVFEALKSEEKGSRSKSTKEGFLYYILKFLRTQELIEFVEIDEMIYPSKKLNDFMDFNLLNKNNYYRVEEILRGNQNE